MSQANDGRNTLTSFSSIFYIVSSLQLTLAWKVFYFFWGMKKLMKLQQIKANPHKHRQSIKTAHLKVRAEIDTQNSEADNAHDLHSCFVFFHYVCHFKPTCTWIQCYLKTTWRWQHYTIYRFQTNVLYFMLCQHDCLGQKAVITCLLMTCPQKYILEKKKSKS